MKKKNKYKGRSGLVNLNKRDEIIERLDELNGILEGKGKKAARAWKTKEQSEVKRLTKELESLNKAIDLQEQSRKALANSKQRKQDRHNPANKEENKIKKRYSILRAIRLAGGIEKKLNGIEGEMHKEALKEARASGFTIEGIGVPSMISEKRLVQEVGTDANAGNLVATELADFVPHLQPKLVLQELGAQVMTGMVGNVDIPVGDTRAAVTATGEKGTSQETTPTIRMVQARPNRYSGTIPVTQQMIMQSSIGMEKYVTNLLGAASDEKINLDCILGGGTNEISGILSTITPTPLGANGAQLTRDFLLNMEERIDDSNAIDSKRHFLTNNQVKRFAKGLKVDTGSGKFLWEKGSKMVDYDALSSSLLPSDLTKGTSVGICSAIILANFSRYVMINWGTKDLIYDPFSRKKDGIKEVTINTFWDGFITHEMAFDAYVDVLTA